MGYKAKLKRIGKERKHQTKKLREIIGTDLLTRKEQIIKNEVAGLYSLTNEEAYYKFASDKPTLHITEFTRRLKAIDNFFEVVPCELMTLPHKPQGHSIYYNVPAYGGFIKVCNVGKNREYEIPAESVGWIQEAKDQFGEMDEVPLVYRGWVAALECCKLAYQKWEDDGISPAMIMNEKEVLNIRNSFKLIGFENKIKELKIEHEKALTADNEILMQAQVDNRKNMFEIDNDIEIEIEDIIELPKMEDKTDALQPSTDTPVCSN